MVLEERSQAGSSMKFIFLTTVFGYALLAAAFFVLVSRLFFPHHRVVAVLLLFLSLGLLVFAFAKHTAWITRQADAVQHVLIPNIPYILFAVAVCVFGYVFWVLVPTGESPLLQLPASALKEHMNDDAEGLLALNNRMRTLQDRMREDPLFTKDSPVLTEEERHRLRSDWQEFLQIFLELDIIKNRYKTFPRLNGSPYEQAHTDAFLLAYGAFLTQYTAALSLVDTVNGAATVETVLNEENSAALIPKNMYAHISAQLTEPNEILRLNAGRAYAALRDASFSHRPLVHASMQSHLRTIDSSLNKFPRLFIKHPLDFFEKKAFDYWLPVQKKAAIQLSYVRATDRPYFISADVVASFEDRLQPGDILLERRNWHATNAGIPGFWPHAALYIGSLEHMDRQFADLELLQGMTASEYIKMQYPAVYDALTEPDADGFVKRVIEAKRPGVVLFSLEESANADALGVVRPNIPKSEVFGAILTAFSHFGKPYDFNFDFTTDNALVCSELIYKAFERASDIHFDPMYMNGRLLLSPNDIAKKFDAEYDATRQELQFILFLDANESEGRVEEKDAEAFRESWKRPKWQMLYTSGKELLKKHI